MQNQNIRYSDGNNEEERFHSDDLISFIENDYVLNYLNGPDTRRTIPQANTFNPIINNMPMTYSHLQDPLKNPDHFSNMYDKLNYQDAWFLQNLNDPNKHHSMSRPVAFKPDTGSDGGNSNKNKKLKVDQTSASIDLNSVKTKSNIKNTYINKINSLISEVKEPKSEENKADSRTDPRRSNSTKNEMDSTSLDPNRGGLKRDLSRDLSYDDPKNDDSDKLNIKLARNRESARNSRQRKKVYIELLEKKVENLQKELANSKKQLDMNSNSINKLSGDSKLISNIHSGKQQMFEKLDKLICNGAEEAEVNLLIDSLIFRLGASGKERTNAINFFFKQIVDLNVPVHMKYLLWTATDGKDLFSSKDTTLMNNLSSSVMGRNEFQNETTEYWNELNTQMNITEHQKKGMLKHRKKLVNEKIKFEGIIHNLNAVRRALIKEAGSLQDVLDDFRNILTPAQTAKFLLILDKERSRKEFSVEKFWKNAFGKKDGGEDKPESEGSNFGDSLDNLNDADLALGGMEEILMNSEFSEQAKQRGSR